LLRKPLPSQRAEDSSGRTVPMQDWDECQLCGWSSCGAS
jgi:hypothetical protein